IDPSEVPKTGAATMSLPTKLRKFWKWLSSTTLRRHLARRALSVEALEVRMLMTGGIPGPLGYGDIKMQLATVPAISTPVLSLPELHSILPENYTNKTATLYLDFDGQEARDFGVVVGPITFNLR